MKDNGNLRAFLAATVMKYYAECSNAHIYDDGMILQLPITDDRHLDLRESFADMGLAFEEARIGGWSAFVFDFDASKGVENPTVGRLIILADKYADHRWGDDWLVEHALYLFAKLLEIKEKNDT
jgi:hypothetical protein